MNWKDDPLIKAEIASRGVHSQLVRSAILWTPLFLLALFGALYFAVDTILGGDHGGTWVLVVIISVLAVLFGFQCIQTLLDLRGEPRDDAGFVTRRWSRSDSIVMRSHYVRLGKRILRGDVDLLANIKEDDYVEISFYPHSALLVWIEKVPAPEGMVPEDRRR